MHWEDNIDGELVGNNRKYMVNHDADRIITV